MVSAGSCREHGDSHSLFCTPGSRHLGPLHLQHSKSWWQEEFFSSTLLEEKPLEVRFGSRVHGCESRCDSKAGLCTWVLAPIETQLTPLGAQRKPGCPRSPQPLSQPGFSQSLPPEGAWALLAQQDTTSTMVPKSQGRRRWHVTSGAGTSTPHL